MIQSEINTPVTLTSNTDFVRFQEDITSSCRVRCQNGGWLNHNEGNPLYQITKGGDYEVEVSGTYTSATAGAISLALYENGVVDNSTIQATTLATPNDLETFKISKVISSCNVGETIAIGSIPSVNNGTDTPVLTETPIVTNANLTIKRKSGC